MRLLHLKEPVLARLARAEKDLRNVKYLAAAPRASWAFKGVSVLHSHTSLGRAASHPCPAYLDPSGPLKAIPTSATFNQNGPPPCLPSPHLILL